MNTYTFLNGDIAPLDSLTAAERDFVEYESKRAEHHINTLPRRKLAREHWFVAGELDHAAHQFRPATTKEIRRRGDLPPAESLLLRIAGDIAARVGIVAGILAPHEVADPALKAKEWSGKEDEPLDVFHIGQAPDDPALLTYHFSRVQTYDVKGGTIQPQLESFHTQRGETLISLFAFLPPARRAEEITPVLIDELIAHYGLDIRDRLAETFARGYESNSSGPITPSLRQAIFRPSINSLQDPIASPRKTIGHTAHRVFDSAAFTGLYHGSVDRQDAGIKKTLPKEIGPLLRVVLDTLEHHERAWQSLAAPGIRITVERLFVALKELRRLCAKRSDPLAQAVGPIVDSFLGLAAFSPADRERFHQDLQIASLGLER